MAKVKVAINGFGTIGKRVALAVSAQDDMEVVGVTKTRPAFGCDLAVQFGFPLYSVFETQESVDAFHAAGYDCKGTIDDLLSASDVVVDCAPGKMGKGNAEKYRSSGTKFIFQGGEKHDLTGLSYSSCANHAENLGAQSTRVVSCNTTGLARTLVPLYERVGEIEVDATMIRRTADPGDSKKGPVNAIIPVLKVPSHHGPDLMTVKPEISIQSLAVAVPTTLMHMHANVVKLPEGHGLETADVVEMWKNTPRVLVMNGGETGITSTAQIMELARDMGRRWSDLYEIFVWGDGVQVVGDKLYYFQAIHQESDVIPENIDAIRALMGTQADWQVSVDKTDAALRELFGMD